jgi:PhzF family phenazine biosynthesis protein
VKLYQVDAFTDRAFSGNPAGVVLDADKLSVQQMQAIAREMSCSETAFVMRPSRADADLRIRYFTPTAEVPVCGHATIAAFYVRALKTAAEFPTIAKTETHAGVLTIRTRRDGDKIVVCMAQAPPVFERIIDGDTLTQLIGALGIERADVRADVPCQIVSTGHSKVLIPLVHERVLERLRPNHTALSELSSRINCNGYFPFALVDGVDVVTRGRMFAPAIGIAEDPVTGNANGPLGAYLVRYRLVAHDEDRLRFRSEQGMHIGRPGSMDVEVDIREGEPQRVRIYGTAVIVFEAECVPPIVP